MTFCIHSIYNVGSCSVVDKIKRPPLFIFFIFIVKPVSIIFTLFVLTYNLKVSAKKKKKIFIGCDLKLKNVVLTLCIYSIHTRVSKMKSPVCSILILKYLHYPFKFQPNTIEIYTRCEYSIL